MIIRSFTDESVAAALKQVRSQMGGEAVVLKTRRLTDNLGNTVFEVTACLDDVSVGQTSKALNKEQMPVNSQTTSRLSPASFEQPENAVESEPGIDLKLKALEAKLDRLLSHGREATASEVVQSQAVTDAVEALHDADLPREFIQTFKEWIDTDQTESELDDAAIRDQLSSVLENYIEPWADLKAGDRLLVIGPGGAGKTSVIGKLAASAMQTGKLKIGLSSLDHHKVGAIDELESYRELFGLAPEEAENKKKDNEHLTLIDSGPLPNQSEALKTFLSRIGDINPTHTLLVVPAVMRSSDVLDTFKAISTVQVDGVVGSMTDLTSRLGSLIAACNVCDSKLVFFSDAPSGHGELCAPQAETMAARMLTCGVGHE